MEPTIFDQCSIQFKPIVLPDDYGCDISSMSYIIDFLRSKYFSKLEKVKGKLCKCDRRLQQIIAERNLTSAYKKFMLYNTLNKTLCKCGQSPPCSKWVIGCDCEKCCVWKTNCTHLFDLRTAIVDYNDAEADAEIARENVDSCSCEICKELRHANLLISIIDSIIEEMNDNV